MEFKSTMVLSCQDETHLTRRKGENYDNLSLGIILLLELDKRFLNCIQLILGVGEISSLSDLE
jgi:hypothetical protein